jgi:hypothetical protein
MRTYEGHVSTWVSFLKSETTLSDPLLKGHADEDKASLVCLLLHLKELRGKAATSAAGLRLFFAKNLQSTAFLDAAVISTARQACRLTPEELRAKRDAGALPR